MAKKIKFPLILRDDYQVKDLKELQEHFDLDKILNYYKEGKLQQWLQDRYYEAEYAKITELTPSSPKLADELCSILGVGYQENTENKGIEIPKINVEADKKKEEELKRKARAEAERKAREEQERKRKEETERRIREETERKVRAEMEEKFKREKEQKAKEEAERKAREELERKAREEAERKVHEELERKIREEAEQKAKEEAERRAGEEAEQRRNQGPQPTIAAANSMNRNTISDRGGSAESQQENQPRLAVFALVCSILAWVTSGTIILPLPLAIAGIILGIKGRKSRKKKTATAGIIVSSVLIAIYVIGICMAVITLVNSDKTKTPVTEASSAVETSATNKTEKESKKAAASEQRETKKENIKTNDTDTETKEINTTRTSEVNETLPQIETEPLPQIETESETVAASSEAAWSDSNVPYYDQEPAEQVEEEEEFLLPGSDSVSFMGYVIADSLDKEQMQLAIYEIYARHGMIFEDQTVAAYFSDKSWYKGEIPEAEFDYGVLNSVEVENIETIENIIKYRD